MFSGERLRNDVLCSFRSLRDATKYKQRFNYLSAEIWIFGAVMGIVINTSGSLCMEMAADAGYPVSEGTSAAIAVWLFNVFSFILLFLIRFLPSKTLLQY